MIAVNNAGDINLSREAKKQYKSFKKLFDTFSALNQGYNAYGGVNAERGGKRYSADISTGKNKKITANMSDEERYNLLKDREVKNIQNVSELPTEVVKKIPEISSWNDIDNFLGKEKREQGKTAL